MQRHEGRVVKLKTCVAPGGDFLLGVHQPSYVAANLRGTDPVADIGLDKQGRAVRNERNFPQSDVRVAPGTGILEIPNAFPFRGAAFIDTTWADAKTGDPASIGLPPMQECSLGRSLEAWLASGDTARSGGGCRESFFHRLPGPMQVALAASSTDPEDLRVLAGLACDLVFSSGSSEPVGLSWDRDEQGVLKPVIHHHDLFETLANNPNLPDAYKKVMVLLPGTQGGSEIVGEAGVGAGQTHVYEYLRRNSYIPWGHYAANMADDAVRYRIRDLGIADIRAMRHLYYQRTYVRLAEDLGLPIPRRRVLEAGELEHLRLKVLASLAEAHAHGKPLAFTGTLWGWNFGFDFAPSGYRLHASHQQVHQQYALIPSSLARTGQAEQDPNEGMSPFACGDLVAEVTARYRVEIGRNFFEDYIRAVRCNRRTDRQPGESSLIVFEDDQVMLFVPKAQTSAFELQLMPVSSVGHVLEANAACRDALDKAMLLAQQALEGLGARLVTSIEFSRRFDSPDTDQRLLYAFLPKLPYAPGGFSEAQLRHIIGHYPEDFAAACRKVLSDLQP